MSALMRIFYGFAPLALLTFAVACGEETPEQTQDGGTSSDASSALWRGECPEYPKVGQACLNAARCTRPLDCGLKAAPIASEMPRFETFRCVDGKVERFEHGRCGKRDTQCTDMLLLPYPYDTSKRVVNDAACQGSARCEFRDLSCSAGFNGVTGACEQGVWRVTEHSDCSTTLCPKKPPEEGEACDASQATGSCDYKVHDCPDAQTGEIGENRVVYRCENDRWRMVEGQNNCGLTKGCPVRLDRIEDEVCSEDCRYLSHWCEDGFLEAASYVCHGGRFTEDDLESSAGSPCSQLF